MAVRGPRRGGGSTTKFGSPWWKDCPGDRSRRAAGALQRVHRRDVAMLVNSAKTSPSSDESLQPIRLYRCLSSVVGRRTLPARAAHGSLVDWRTPGSCWLGVDAHGARQVAELNVEFCIVSAGVGGCDGGGNRRCRGNAAGQAGQRLLAALHCWKYSTIARFNSPPTDPVRGRGGKRCSGRGLPPRSRH